MEKKKAVIVGAGSGVGRALAMKLSAEGWELVLSSRDARDLLAIKNEADIQYQTTAHVIPVDLSVQFSAKVFLNECLGRAGGVDAIFVTAGVSIGDDGLLAEPQIQQLIEVNYLSIIKLISVFICYFRKRRQGQLAVISSIAAAAPRSRNVVYASAKRGLEAYCRGMQHSLSKENVHLSVIAPGYVDTSLTYGVDLLLSVSSPQQTADFIVQQLDKKKLFSYYPWFWRPITLVLRHLPWWVYKRLSF